MTSEGKPFNHDWGVASLNSKYARVEQAECIQKGNIYKQCRPKCGVSSGSALFDKINTLLVMVAHKNRIIRPSFTLC